MEPEEFSELTSEPCLAFDAYLCLRWNPSVVLINFWSGFCIDSHMSSREFGFYDGIRSLRCKVSVIVQTLHFLIIAFSDYCLS